jgi:hypothetical protein
MTNEAPETLTFKEVIEKYNALLLEATNYVFFVRDIKLQKEQIVKLKIFKANIKNFKDQSIEHKDEKKANTLFHFQCVLNSYISVLEMWIFLKQNKNFDAWIKLIDAQEYLSIALRIDNIGKAFGIEGFGEHLEHIEKAAFPRFSVFNSPAFIIKGGICSVCGQNLSKCEHVENKIYWGKVCKRINFEIVDADHFAIVKNPKDRRCITTEITTDDNYNYYQDCFTWLKTEPVENPDSHVHRFKGMFFSTNLLDIF